MGCVRPLKGFYTGSKTDTGADEIIVCSDRVEELSFQIAQRRVGHPIKPVPGFYELKFNDAVLTQFVDIPCGKCTQCRLDKSRDWAVRCVLEASLHRSNWFITLTFDDAHLPKSGKVCKKDIQLFLKRLRHYSDVRYFACGEYGEKSRRPHYHLILFGLELPPEDLTQVSKDYFSSEIIRKCWPYGNNVCGEMSFKSAAYVARYNMKSLAYDDSSFILMSRRPGLGSEWFKNNFPHITTNKVYFDFGDFHQASLPRYFLEKLKDLDESLYSACKEISKLYKRDVRGFYDFSDDCLREDMLEELAAGKASLLVRSKI